MFHYGSHVWYNVTPKNDTSPLTTPANGIYMYKVHLKEIDVVPSDPKKGHIKYKVRDCVYMKPSQSRYTTFGIGHVTGIISPQSVLVDDIP